MRNVTISTLALAALALSSIAAPSFAGSPYYDDMGMPMTGDHADMVMQQRMMDPSMTGMQPRRRGQYTCAPGEKRTRLQREACGATKS